MPIYAIEQNNTHYVLLYMHIPKTGGTSISQFMTGLGFTEYYGATDDVIKHVSRRPPAHFDYEICDTLFDLEKITCGFAIVRNPFQRFLSFYHWSNFKLAEKRSSDAPEQVVNFDDWAEYTIAHYNDRSTTNGKLIRPQHLYVGPKLQTAFKLEAGLETIFSGLFNALGLHFPQPLHMPKRNVSKDVVPEEFKHPAASTQTIQSIVDLYQKDFELFGYDPNDHPFT